jgi:hypothetical protein
MSPGDTKSDAVAGPVSGPAVADMTAEGVGRVVVLPLSKAIRMAWQNLRLRPARTALTVLSILAAVGFVLFVLASSHIQESARAATAVALTAAEEEAEETAGGRLIWVVVVSLCACTVGIVNAMLMSTTERYREIGTLKCLGALDAFVLKLFLLESVFQGLVGSAAGIVVGLLMAFLAGLIGQGTAAFTAAPWPTLGVDIVIAAVVGMFLSVAGALYPAYVAARMAPVEAMRARI